MPLVTQIAQLILDLCHVNVFKDQSTLSSLLEKNLDNFPRYTFANRNRKT